MKSVPLGRRASAVVALLAPLLVLVVLVAALLRRPLILAAAAVCVSLGVAAAAFAVTRTGPRRILAAALAVLALVAAVLLLLSGSGGLLTILLVVGLVVVDGVASRHALGRDLPALKSSPTPGTPVGPAARPVLLMNPKSGGGKVERFNLVEEARRRGIEPVVLAPGDDLLQLAEQAVAGGADVIGMAGGDGSQALVATVATRHDVGFVCVPAGTRNHLAMDLGLDRADVAGALDAFGEAVERRIDLGMVGGRVFVNNATVGLYAKIVQSPAYRDRKVGTALELLPEMLGPGATPFDLRFTGPDGTEHASAHLILVSNDRYQLGSGEGFGSRRRIDAGSLGIVAATFRSSGELARLLESVGGGRSWRPPGWAEWSDDSFLLHSAQPVEIGIDGEAMLLDPPLEFRTLPGVLRVRVPRQAPGYSPAAAAPPKGWAAVTALLQTAAGRPVAIAS
ncbi:MAG TPA: diacylglycerol kinase family protein [Actinomycetota bacterium]|nr:diacylglycerol kinase family protein [Actinomycetota bacterium]